MLYQVIILELYIEEELFPLNSPSTVTRYIRKRSYLLIYNQEEYSLLSYQSTFIRDTLLRGIISLNYHDTFIRAI